MRLPKAVCGVVAETLTGSHPKIEALFSRPRPAFVVVGAAHLVGPDGLLQMLTAKGYRIEQL